MLAKKKHWNPPAQTQIAKEDQSLSSLARFWKERYLVQMEKEKAVFFPILDWHKIQKHKTKNLYRIPVQVTEDQQNLIYLMIDEDKNRFFYRTKVGISTDQMIFIHHLDGSLDFFISQKNGDQRACRLKNKSNSPYNIRFAAKQTRVSLDSIDIICPYPSIDWFWPSIDIDSNWGTGGGCCPVDPPAPLPPPQDEPCPGDPIKKPKIAPTVKTNGEINVAGGTYGPTRNNGNKFHNGIDIAADIGTPLYPMFAGTVVAVAQGNYFGNFIIIQSNVDGHTIQVTYAHLSEVFVSQGQYMGMGGYIGLSGDTGNASSVPNKHVHIEVKEKNDQNQWIRKDPKDYLNTQFDDEFQPDPNNSKCNKP